jgi:hypothetical protein
MASTRRALIDAVLDNLGVLVFGQAPTDEMVSRVDGLVDPVLAELAALEIVYVGDAGTPGPPAGGEIDDAIFPSLSDYVAFAVAAPFGLGADPALKVLSDQAEETLRRIGRPARTRKTLTTDIQLRAGNRRYAQFNYTTGR